MANRLEQLISDSGDCLYPEIAVELAKTVIIGLSVDAVVRNFSMQKGYKLPRIWKNDSPTLFLYRTNPRSQDPVLF